MTLASVRQHLAQHAPDLKITELPVSAATVALAAAAFGVEPGQIVKTLTLMVADDIVLLVAAGDARLSNRKFKDVFAVKPRMLPAEDVERETGHPVGGVSPFGLAKPLRVYCDESLRRFAEVLPSGGAPNTGIRISPERMARLSSASWVDVTAPHAGPSTNEGLTRTNRIAAESTVAVLAGGTPPAHQVVADGRAQFTGSHIESMIRF